ncbi:MAG: hypothetical protein HC911_07695 [Chloroflexaceae bacterium]|nr:hypothetical protein [Chloroflexaceae bacterium]
MPTETETVTRRPRTQRSRVLLVEAPDASAVRATIRAMWLKERRTGSYAPTDELVLDLDQLDLGDLLSLKNTIRARLTACMLPVQSGSEAGRSRQLVVFARP